MRRAARDDGLPSRKEGFLRALLGVVADAPIFVYGRDLRVVEFFWEREDREWPIDPAAFVGRPLAEVTDPEDAATFERTLREVFETGLPQRFEATYRIPGGAVVLDVRLAPIRGETGEVDYVLSASVDLSDRLRAAAALLESERRFETLAESLPVGVMRSTAEGRTLYRNRFAQELSGVTDAELAERGWKTTVHPDDRERVAATRSEIFREPRIWEQEMRMLRPDGKTIWVFSRSAPVWDGEGNFDGLITSFVDISEQKAAIDALRDSEYRFRSLAEAMPLGIWRADASLRIVYANRRLWELLDLEPESISQVDVGELVARATRERRLDPEDARRLGALAERAIRERSAVEFEMRWRVSDGSVRSLHTRSEPEFDAAGAFVGHVGMLSDLTGLRRAEDELRESEHRFRSLAEAMPIGVWRSNRSLELLYANRRNWELLGMDPSDPQNRDTPRLLMRMVGRGDVASEDLERLIDEGFQAVRDETLNPSAFSIRRPDGSLRHLRTLAVPESDASGSFVGHVGVTIDVTDVERAQQELARHRDHLGELVAERTAELERSYAALRRSERLAAVGTFAAGIAHQINNPVGSILLAAQFAQEDPDDRARVRSALRDIEEDARRCGRIVRGVLEFAQGPIATPKPCDLNRIVREGVQKLARETLERGSALHVDLAAELPPAAGSDSALEQVLANLVTNAVEAAATRILVETRESDAGLLLVVRDDGCGIDERNLDQVFDPLFTTRALRGGTGLGLTLARGVVEAYGGSIEVESRAGDGTTVTVRLARA